MKVISAVKSFSFDRRNSVVTIGVFDGVHLGHQLIIKKVMKRAKKLNVASVVLTFHPHPMKVLRHFKNFPLLTCLKQRLRLIEKLGPDYCFIVKFTKKLSRMSPNDFIEKILVEKLKPCEIFVGANFTFGRRAKGNFKALKAKEKEYGLKARKIMTLKKKNLIISSSRIRSLIEDGKLKTASVLLGRPFFIEGRVIKGDTRGKLIGYPTANVKPKNQIIPACGVYIVEIKLKQRQYFGISYIGKRPTFRKRKKIIEVHIFNFKGRIYGRKIKIGFYERLRPEKFFSRREDLIKQIKKDEKKARSFFKVLENLPNFLT